MIENNLIKLLRIFINWNSLLGLLIVVDGIGSYQTGVYSAGNFGRIDPGEYGVYLSILQVVGGIAVIGVGVFYGIKKYRNSK